MAVLLTVQKISVMARDYKVVDSVKWSGFATSIAVDRMNRLHLTDRDALDGVFPLMRTHWLSVQSGANESGAVYVYVKPQNGWEGVLNESAVLYDPGGASQDFFGYRVGISGDTILAGSPHFLVYNHDQSHLNLTGDWLYF